jgi:hypothetical protein
MKISQIIQETSTTAGSVAPVEHGFVKMQTRNPGVYGGNKVGNLLKGKKTSKPFANSLNEAAMKDLAYDLQTMKPAEFQKKYGKTREEMKASMNKQPQQRPAPPVNETDLSEQDLIVVPGQGRSVKTGFVPHDKDRTDHEVEMAVSDLFSAGKNAEKIYNIVRSVSEEEGLEGWVQEKIIKANDYLNTVREYLEGKQLRSVTENNQRGDSLVTDALKIMRSAEVSDAVKALKTVLGDREYNSRRGFYNFYIRQMIDAYSQQGVAEGEENKYGSQENWDSLRKDIKSQYPYKKGTTVTVPHKGKLVNGKIVRYEAGGGGYSPAYVVDIGEYESIMVQPNKVRRGATESLGTTGAMTNGEMGEGKKVDRMVKHVAQTEKKLGHSKKEAENIAWATANKRGMLNNKNKKA